MTLGMPIFDIIEQPLNPKNRNNQTSKRTANKESGRSGGGLISLFTKMNKDSIQDIYKGKHILKSESLMTDKFRG